MPNDYTPDRTNAVWTDPIATPKDGEDCDESMFDLPFQQLADRVEGTRELCTYMSTYEGDFLFPGLYAYGQSAAIATKTLSLLDDTSMTPLSATHIAMFRGGIKFITVTTGTNEAHRVVLRIPQMPQFYGRTISSANVIAIPAAGHAALPTEQPCATMRRVNESSCVSLRSADGANATTWQSLGVGDVTTYNSGGLFSLAWVCDQNNVYDPGFYAYEILVRNEAGTNALAGLRIAGMSIIFADP